MSKVEIVIRDSSITVWRDDRMRYQILTGGRLDIALEIDGVEATILDEMVNVAMAYPHRSMTDLVLTTGIGNRIWRLVRFYRQLGSVIIDIDEEDSK